MITASFPSSEPVLVATKLHVPPLRAGLVHRRELLARLVAERDRKLTLVCAPAGWGKSTLLSEWGASPDETRPFAWLSLDPADRDPVRFWSYAIGAFRSVRPDVRVIVADAYTYGAWRDPERALAEATRALDWGLDTPRVHAIKYFAAFDWVAEETGTYTLQVTSFESVSTGELVVTRG